MSDVNGAVDYALVAFLEDGDWKVQDIASPAFESVESLSHALRQVSGPQGAVGMVAVDEDFFVLVRVSGSTTRVLLSDVTAAEEWELAHSVVEFLGLPPPTTTTPRCRPATSTCSATSGCTPSTWARCSTTSSSTLTTCSPTSRSASASATSSTTPSA